MKNVGIVRRLDELGRIVIPREFRKTHRINVGDPLEIMATESGSIVITKVDRLTDLIALTGAACTTLSAELNLTIAASSFDTFVAAGGQNRGGISGKELPEAVMGVLKDRGTAYGKTESFGFVDTPFANFENVCFVPILSYDDSFGGIFAFSDAEISAHNMAAIKLAGRLVGEALSRY